MAESLLAKAGATLFDFRGHSLLNRYGNFLGRNSSRTRQPSIGAPDAHPTLTNMNSEARFQKKQALQNREMYRGAFFSNCSIFCCCSHLMYQSGLKPSSLLFIVVELHCGPPKSLFELFISQALNHKSCYRYCYYHDG